MTVAVWLSGNKDAQSNQVTQARFAWTLYTIVYTMCTQHVGI